MAAILAVAGCGTATDTGDDVALRFADNFSTLHPVAAHGSVFFIEQLKERGSQVGLDIDLYPSGQLGKFQDLPTILTSGIADIGGVVPAYQSAQMPLTSGFDLPGYTSDACVGAAAVTRAVSPGSTAREEEINRMGIRPLWSVHLTGYELMSTERTTDPHGQRGAILRSPGGAVDRVLGPLGAAGVSMPLGDMYEAISRGTVDGTVASPTSMAPYKLAEVLSHSTVGAQLGSVTILYSISEEQWQRLNEPQRQVISEAAAATEENLCRNLNDLLPKSLAQMEKDGTSLTHLTEAQQAEWRAEVSEPAREAWVSDLSDMGLPARDLLTDWEKALNEEGHSSD